MRAGLTALPNAAADAAGGLPISDAGGLNIDAIKTKTDFLPSATAGAAGGVFIAGANAATSVATALTANITGNLSGSVGSVTGAVASVTGAVGSVTGLTASDVGAIKSKTDQLTFTGANRVDANVEAIDNDTLAATTLKNAANSTINGQAVTGTLSATQATTNLPNATNDAYNGRVLTWEGNVTTALTGQQTDITDYDGATKMLTFTALTTAPANTDRFVIH